MSESKEESHVTLRDRLQASGRASGGLQLARREHLREHLLQPRLVAQGDRVPVLVNTQRLQRHLELLRAGLRCCLRRRVQPADKLGADPERPGLARIILITTSRESSLLF